MFSISSYFSRNFQITWFKEEEEDFIPKKTKKISLAALTPEGEIQKTWDSWWSRPPQEAQDWRMRKDFKNSSGNLKAIRDSLAPATPHRSNESGICWNSFNQTNYNKNQ